MAYWIRIPLFLFAGSVCKAFVNILLGYIVIGRYEMRITGITFIRSIGDIQKSRMMGKFHILL